MKLSTLIYLLQLVFICGLNVSIATADIPHRVRVGGFFSPLTRTGSLYLDQAEHLAAFMMAANDINNKTDGLFDKLLPNTAFHIALGFEDSLSSAATNAVNLGYRGSELLR
jgi:predicted ABC-type ATPase